jgi:hypothetical protein
VAKVRQHVTEWVQGGADRLCSVADLTAFVKDKVATDVAKVQLDKLASKYQFAPAEVAQVAMFLTSILYDVLKVQGDVIKIVPPAGSVMCIIEPN